MRQQIADLEKAEKERRRQLRKQIKELKKRLRSKFSVRGSVSATSSPGSQTQSQSKPSYSYTMNKTECESPTEWAPKSVIMPAEVAQIEVDASVRESEHAE